MRNFYKDVAVATIDRGNSVRPQGDAMVYCIDDKVFANFGGPVFPLGRMLDRHMASPNGLAHFLREHKEVKGFRMGE